MTHLEYCCLDLTLPEGKEWYKVSEAETYTGWSQNYLIDEIHSGALPAQCRMRESNKTRDYRSLRTDQKPLILRSSYKIHRRDLVLWLAKDGKFSSETTFLIILEYLKTSPEFLKQAAIQALQGQDITSTLRKWATHIPLFQRKRYATTGRGSLKMIKLSEVKPPESKSPASRSGKSSTGSKKKKTGKGSPSSSGNTSGISSLSQKHES